MESMRLSGGTHTENGGGCSDALRLRRKAIELSAQMPADPAEQRQVINYMLILLNDFMEDDPRPGEGRLHVIQPDGG